MFEQPIRPAESISSCHILRRSHLVSQCSSRVGIAKKIFPKPAQHLRLRDLTDCYLVINALRVITCHDGSQHWLQSLDFSCLLGYRSSSHYRSSSIEANMSGVNILAVKGQLFIGVGKAHPTKWWSRSGYILSPLFDFYVFLLSLSRS